MKNKKKILFGTIGLIFTLSATTIPFLSSCSSNKSDEKINSNDGETEKPPVNNGGDDDSPSNPGNEDSSNNGNQATIDNSIQNYDFFVLPSNDPNDFKNRITIPFTKNQEIIKKYGNVPLPWKEDHELTKQDIMNMFTYLTLYGRGVDVYFGERKIDSNLFNDCYFEWTITYHKYFPYKTLDNPPPLFRCRSEDGKLTSPGEIPYKNLNNDFYVNKTKWYIDKVQWSDFEDIYFDGQSRKEYIEFITELFRYIQPNMTDVEKFYLSHFFVINWVKYCGNYAGPSFNTNGCCADYANMFSLALQLLDVPAVPIGCGYQAEDHAIVWVYLDLYGNGQKKWYASDPTFSDNDTNPYKGILGLSPHLPSKNWILFDVGIDQFTSIDMVEGVRPFQHDISNNVYGSIWSTVGKNESSIGDVSYGRQDDYTRKYFDYFTNSFSDITNNNPKRSRVFFIDGYTYYFEKNDQAENGIQLIKRKAVINSEPIIEPINLDYTYKNKFRFSEKNDVIPLVQQFGNKLALFINPNYSSINNASILILDVENNGINWKSCREYVVPNFNNDSNQRYVYNFNIDINGQLRIEYAKKYRTQTQNILSKYIDMGEKFKSEFSFTENNFNRSGDVEIAKQYFSAIIGMYKIAENREGYININDKRNFYKYMNSQNEYTPYQSILNILNEYKNLENKIHSSSGRLIQSKLLDSLYIKQKSAFDEFGFDFGNFTIYDNPDNIIGNSIVKANYNIYYSENKPTSEDDLKKFDKIVSNASKPIVHIEDLESKNYFNGSGYYFIEIEKNNEKNFSNVCELRLVNQDDFLTETKLYYYSDTEPNLFNTKLTNYNQDELYWYESKINFHFEIYYNTSLFESEYSNLKVELKYKDINTNEIKIVKDSSWFDDYNDKSRGKIYGNLSFSEPSDKNAGIYYIETSFTNNTTKKIIKQFSNFNFILDLDDYENWDKNLWINSIQKIIKQEIE